jgi:hypothetical protein
MYASTAVDRLQEFIKRRPPLDRVMSMRRVAEAALLFGPLTGGGVTVALIVTERLIPGFDGVASFMLLAGGATVLFFVAFLAAAYVGKRRAGRLRLGDQEPRA